MHAHTRPVGDLLREWRQRRRLSQLALACEAEISARHLSFLETGRSRPSRDMVLHLSERLDVPLRDRNGLLVAAGFAPIYPERSLADPALDAAREAVRLVLTGHEPSPAIAVDRHWTLVASNGATGPLIAGADAALLSPPVNVLRLSLHPRGLAPRIVNLAQWRGHLLDNLRRQIEANGDPVLEALREELEGYPAPPGGTPVRQGDLAGIVVPLRVRHENEVLTFLSTTTIFGTPVDVTLSELAIETFFPADPQTADALRRMSAAG